MTKMLNDEAMKGMADTIDNMLNGAPGEPRKVAFVLVVCPLEEGYERNYVISNMEHDAERILRYAARAEMVREQ